MTRYRYIDIVSCMVHYTMTMLAVEVYQFHRIIAACAIHLYLFNKCKQ